jgi:hypothetical protein
MKKDIHASLKQDFVDTFEIEEKELIENRRFGVIAILCKKILELERKGSSVSVTCTGVRKGFIQYKVYKCAY